MKTTYNWGHALPLLTTDRLCLRSLTANDADGIFAVFGDPEVIQYWSTPALPDVQAAALLIKEINESFVSRHLFQWGVCTHESSEIFGTCTLKHIDWPNRRVELGIAIGRSAWGKGYGREALAGLLQFAFGTLNLHRLEADIDPANTRSIALFESLGFHREGLLRERWHIHGQILDTLMMGLLRHEWAGRS